MNLNMPLAKPIKTVKLTVVVRALLGSFFVRNGRRLCPGKQLMMLRRLIKSVCRGNCRSNA